MKMFKRIAAVVMATAMVAACFAGCGSNEASDKFIIGATGPLTGDASSYGISVQRGAQVAIDEINAAGGLNGYKFEFMMKDDKAAPEDAATAYDQLMDAGMQISIGSVTSGACESFAAKSVEDNLFFITPSASRADIIADRDNGFRICFGDPDQGYLAAETIVNDYKYTKIGCIYDTSDTYSSGIYEAFSEKMKELKVEFTTKTFDQETNKDFSTQVEALKDCEVIFLPIYYTEAGLIARACTAKGSNAMILGCDGLDGVVDQIDETVTTKIKYITPFDVNSTDKVVSDFVKKYKEKYDAAPDQFAADGYDAIYAIYNAMKAAIDNGTELTPETSVSDMCDAVREVMISKSFKFTGATGSMTWDAKGAPTKVPTIVDVNA